MSRVVAIGVGTPYRGDDAAGIEAARLLREAAPAGVEVVEHAGEPAGLLDLWEGAEVAYLIDAVRSDDPPGTIHRLEAGAGIPASPRRDSSHALGLGDAVALAHALGRLPPRLVVIGVTGRSFAAGDEMSAAVRRAVRTVAEEIAGEARRLPCA